MEPDPKKLKPSGVGEEGSEVTNPQLNQPLYANFPRRSAIGTNNEGPIIVSQPAQSTSEAARGEQAGRQNLVNEGSTQAVEELVGEIVELKMKKLDIDRRIREVKEKIKSSSEDDNNKRWKFVTKEDLESSPSLQNKMLLVVKAPPETTIDRNPSKQGVTFRSNTGDVNVYLAKSENHKIKVQINPNSRIIQISPAQEAPDIPEPETPDVRANEDVSARGKDAPNHNLDDVDRWIIGDLDAAEVDWDEFNAIGAIQNASVPLPVTDAGENEINPRTACLNANTSHAIAAVTKNNMPDYNNVDDYWLGTGSNEASLSDLWADRSMTRETTATDNLPSLDEVLRQKPKPSGDDT